MLPNHAPNRAPNSPTWVYLGASDHLPKVRQIQKKPGLAWVLSMEPSGFEPLTPCMPCSDSSRSDQLQRNGSAHLFQHVLRQFVRQTRLNKLSPKAVLSGRFLVYCAVWAAKQFLLAKTP